MADPKSAIESPGNAPRRKTLHLPRTDAPTPAVTSPSPAPARAAAKPACQLDVDEQFIHEAMCDGVVLDLAFLDGTALRGMAMAVGIYSLRLRCDDGAEVIVFKAALKTLRRAAEGPRK